MDASEVINSFCTRARHFFHASGAYYWTRQPNGDLLGSEADGFMSDSFRGTRLGSGDSAVAVEAVSRRRAVYNNAIDPQRYAMLAQYQAKAALAVPLLVSGEVIGALVFLRDAPGSSFDEDAAAKATIMAGQLGTALEALRLNEVSREERRRAMILAEVAATLPRMPDTAAVIEGIADRLRVLLRSPAVLIFVQDGNSFQLQAVSADTSRTAQSIRGRYQDSNLAAAMDTASRAVSAGERIELTVDGPTHLGSDFPSGVLIAAPFRTSRTHGSVLVYPRSASPFSEEEKTLVSALAGFGAVAIANAELYGIAHGQAQELHEILEISFDLGSAGKLDHFMRTFVVRAASFLGFRRCFLGMMEDGAFRVRWGVQDGAARPLDIFFPGGIAARTLLQKSVFQTEDASSIPGANADFINAFQVRQLLAVPLLGSSGEIVGMFGMLDRVAPGAISDEDVRRARSLAAQAAIALELTQNLHRSDEHRRRAEALVSLALELNTVLHLPDFSRNFVRRAADLLGGEAVALCLFQEGAMDTVLQQSGSEVHDKPLLLRFNAAVSSALSRYEREVIYASAADLLGPAFASSLGWSDCTLVRLAGASGNLVGVLCLADRGAPPDSGDEQLLRALAGHASIALENACLFTRMEQANRHWVEVFDAISDFIVVHDEGQNILRVNRPLAEFVGLAPEELIGLNMRALEMLSTGAPPHSCPFCRSGDGIDEYVHPILERAYLISTSRIHAASSAQLQTVHVLKDITDRREAERRYRELFDNIQEGIFFTTPQGRFVEVNDALVQILGYDSREEVLQLDIPAEVYFTPERRTELLSLVERDVTLRNYEEVLRRKDGSPIHVLINSFAVRDNNGKIQQYRGLILDISSLRQSQTELQRERDFSNKVLNNTQSLILVTDTQGVISYANRRWSGLGFTQSQLIGTQFASLVAPARREVLHQALYAVTQGHLVDNLDVQLMRADGVSGHFSVNLSPISSDDKSVNSIVVVMTDVTDSAMLQAKLMHAEKMAAVGQLVSGVAHEVNNPLTAILGFTDLLMENPELPDGARRDLRVILQEAQRTKQIVQNLLSFARQMPPQRRPVQLNAILRRTLQLRAYDFTSHGIEVLERLDESLPEVIGDSHQLQQVFLNIINNAYDAVRETSRTARIEITTARSESAVEVSFRDNGAGIEYPDRIFDPFFTTKEVGKGTGLGLSICYGIVREHGGEIVCHNNLDSEGATFIVRLPLAVEEASFGAVAGAHPK
jgi:two-component system NtrC family sensor kinase